jgi:hypothetical protein
LTEAGADLDRVRFVAPGELVRRVRGVRRAKLYCDDFTDLDRRAMEDVIRAEQYLDW